ncbi:MAG: glycosyltransferase family 1 protein, partial [Gordonia amarae]
MTDLAQVRLVYVAPAHGRSGVGDYATDFIDAIRPHVLEVIEYRIDTEGSERLSEVVRHMRGVRAAVRKAGDSGPVIAHFEQSAGSLSTFWAAALPAVVPVTATIHDAPRPVWWPFKTELLTRHRLMHHAVHYPLRPLSDAVQRRVSRNRTVFTLTTIGADRTRQLLRSSRVVPTRIFVPDRDDTIAVTDRPPAVGLFGHVYKGKGFDLIDRLRAGLDDGIDIVVAGRGTENLPPTPGVRILGEVNGADEDAFFTGIRFLVVPYSKDNKYGKVWAASSAVARSFAYGTPIVCILDGSLAETAAEGGAVGVDSAGPGSGI